jgi:hypothetical protein
MDLLSKPHRKKAEIKNKIYFSPIRHDPLYIGCKIETKVKQKNSLTDFYL